MNTSLKRLAGTALVAFAIAFTANAQESRPANEATIKKNTLEMFGMNLQTKEYPGVIEGTLYNIIECKALFPDLNYSDLVEPLNELAREHGDLLIGYKASLAGLYLAHSSDFHITLMRDAANHDNLFKQIADQLEQKLVVLENEPTILSEIK